MRPTKGMSIIFDGDGVGVGRSLDSVCVVCVGQATPDFWARRRRASITTMVDCEGIWNVQPCIIDRVVSGRGDTSYPAGLVLPYTRI